MKRFLPTLFIFSAFLLAGCPTTPEKQEESAAPVETTTQAAPVTPAKVESEPQTGLTGILTNRSIYFDYDKFDIKPEYHDLVAAHARYLTNNRQQRMMIQGNTDDRGSREYNLALGQKRADAVKKQLILLGAREDQLESVSLGKEKPRDPGQNEAAWAENRRSDMLYSGEF